MSRRWPEAQKYWTVRSSLVAGCFSGAEETENWELEFVLMGAQPVLPHVCPRLRRKNYIDINKIQVTLLGLILCAYGSKKLYVVSFLRHSEIINY